MDCLITKLKAGINSNEMPWLNGMKIRLTGGFNYSSTNGATVGINAPVVVKESGTPLGFGKKALLGSHSYVFENEGEIYIIVKETNAALLFNSRNDGFDKAQVICTINDYIDGALLVSANSINADAFILSGNISDFARYKMSIISYRPVTNALFGSLESLVEGYYRNGVTDGYEFSVYIPNAPVTFHAAAISTGLTISFNSGIVTVKNASTLATLATYNGTTWSYS